MAYETDPAILAGWLTIEQAAKAYGVSERTIRRRLADKTLTGGHVQTVYGREWRIEPPAEPIHPPGDRSAPGQDQAGAPPDALLTLADVERLLSPVVQERDRLLAQVEALQVARLADAQAIGRLQGRLEATEAEVERLRAAPPPGPATAPPAANPPAPAPVADAPRRRWPWQR